MIVDSERQLRDFAGTIVQRGDPEYANASRTPLAFGNPALVLRPAQVADLQAAVRWAAESGLDLAVRGGGHSFAGFGTNDGGVVIDLGALSSVDVIDPVRHRVRIGGGATWGAVAAALAPHGLALSAGDTRTVGVGGLTLGGGIGWKVRKYGLALDQLVAAELVTADGALRRVSANEHPDLFWAIRGGGGNLGIVTAFEFVAHPAREMFHGTISFPVDEVERVLHGWADYLRDAPDDLTTTAVMANPFAGGVTAPLEIHIGVDTDDDAVADRLLAPIRDLGTVVGDTVVRKPGADVLEDGAVLPPGLDVVMQSGFLERAAVPEALATLTEVGTSAGTPLIAIRSLGGAVSRVPVEATAYAHRNAELLVITGIAGPAPVIAAARTVADSLWQRLEPLVSGAYGGFQTAASAADVAAIYPDATRAKLAAIKRMVDPRNLFSGNHNVRP